MKKKISNQFFTHYLIMFILIILATVLAVSLLSFASQLASSAFSKNKYPASSIMQDDYKRIDASTVVQNGGSVQVIDKEYRVVFSEGNEPALRGSGTAEQNN